jgi:hypothetical protein
MRPRKPQRQPISALLPFVMHTGRKAAHQVDAIVGDSRVLDAARRSAAVPRCARSVPAPILILVSAALADQPYVSPKRLRIFRTSLPGPVCKQCRRDSAASPRS